MYTDTKVYFMRHAETKLNRQKCFAGITETNITGKGAIEARKNFPFKENDFDVYYCSPLSRTRQTLDAVLPNHPEPIIDSRIIERDFGLWKGVPYQSVSDWLTEQCILGNYDPPHGETYKHLQDRVYDFVTEMFKIHKNKRILVVTHATILRMVRDLFLTTMEKKPIKNSQILIVTKNDVFNVKEE